MRTARAKRPVRRVLSVLSPAILFIGCDMIGNAYQCGYDGGYGFVDFVYGCAASCEQQRLEREQKEAVWNDACDLSVQAAFATQAALDEANRACEDQYGFGSAIRLCEDLGQEIDFEPSGCRPYDEPLLGVPVEGNYACPAGAAGAELCLCCDEGGGADCALAGGTCWDNSRCCSGSCDLPPQSDAGVILDADGGVIDGGVLPAPRGSCR
ncbi:MAG: hypothetical protein IT383_23690 [Deltaproteobacteria bacterium]|nr:hypothetical protein [Deltaproteobacteria bacterium]